MESIIAKLLQDFEQGKMSRRQLIQSDAHRNGGVSAQRIPGYSVRIGDRLCGQNRIH